jgi:hypothetical protein
MIDFEQVCVDIDECITIGCGNLECVNNDGDFECITTTTEEPTTTTVGSPCDFQKRIDEFCAQMSPEGEGPFLCPTAVPGMVARYSYNRNGKNLGKYFFLG